MSDFKRLCQKEYRKTKQFKFEQLQELETKWRRRATIAGNKLEEVRKQINRFIESEVKGK